MNEPLAGYLSVREAALLLGVTKSTIRAQITKGQISTVWAGRQHFLAPSELLRYRTENQSTRQHPSASPALTELASALGAKADRLELQKAILGLSGLVLGNEFEARSVLSAALRGFLIMDHQKALSEPSGVFFDELSRFLRALAAGLSAKV
jgi:excisionase family DNA binding protein